MGVKHRNRVLTIDPGLSGTGWSAWSVEDNVRSDVKKMPWRLDGHGAFTPRGDSLQERLADVTHHVSTLLRDHVLAEVGVSRVTLAVEHPQYFSGAVATNKSGALVSLAMAAGAAIGASSISLVVHPLLVPLTWKGNLPKDVCCERILERVRRDPRCVSWVSKTGTTHEIDAVGIGLHLQGRF